MPVTCVAALLIGLADQAQHAPQGPARAGDVRECHDAGGNLPLHVDGAAAPQETLAVEMSGKWWVRPTMGVDGRH